MHHNMHDIMHHIMHHNMHYIMHHNMHYNMKVYMLWVPWVPRLATTIRLRQILEYKGNSVEAK